MRNDQQKVGLPYVWIFALLLLVTFAWSCENEATSGKMEGYPVPLSIAQKPDSSFQLIATDTLRMKVDNSTSNVAYIEQVKVLDGGSRYFFYNPNQHNIQYYNLASGEKEGNIPLSLEGPNGVPDFTGFYVHNLDSVFLVGYMPSRIYLVNRQGKLSKKWDFTDGSELSTPELTTEYFYELTFNPEKNAITSWFYPPATMVTEKDYYLRKGICIEVYLDKLDDYQTFGVFPENYTQGDAIYDFYSEIGGYLTPDYHLVNFIGSHEVHLYDRETKTMVKRLNLKSEFASENIAPSRRMGQDELDSQKQDEYMTSTPGYVKMMHNEDFSLHYRILKHGVSLTKGDQKRHFFDKPFSVAVYDAEFRLLTEKEFSGGIYDFYNSFAHGQHLYLSLNSELNDYNQEDFMQFEIQTLLNERELSGLESPLNNTAN